MWARQVEGLVTFTGRAGSIPVSGIIAVKGLTSIRRKSFLHFLAVLGTFLVHLW
jgi:hypothetical protein